MYFLTITLFAFSEKKNHFYFCFFEIQIGFKRVFSPNQFRKIQVVKKILVINEII